MHLFLGPPDTTGLTQLLDQVNKGLHLAYKEEKKQIFAPEQTINREGFMHILANAWDKWVTKETLVKCAKRVGVTTVTTTTADTLTDINGCNSEIKMCSSV